jgi:hypothetical protein
MLAAAALELVGARVSVMLAEMSGEEEEWGSGAYPLRQVTFYRRQRSAAFILSVQEAAANRASAEAPPSCFPARG